MEEGEDERWKSAGPNIWPLPPFGLLSTPVSLDLLTHTSVRPFTMKTFLRNFGAAQEQQGGDIVQGQEVDCHCRA